MIWQNNEPITADITDGIVVDFFQNRFVLVIKDKIWTEYERKAFYQNPLHIYFGYERICAFFLFENVDSIDTSDTVFDIHECDEKEQLLKQDSYDMEIYLIDAQNHICASRCITFHKHDTELIRETLMKQMNAVYDEAGFDRALYKLQHTYEPFEMEQLALVKATF